jgi:hypothetical protein
MAALREDISFRYLKQFFLVNLAFPTPGPLIIEVKYIRIILNPNLMDLVVPLWMI